MIDAEGSVDEVGAAVLAAYRAAFV